LLEKLKKKNLQAETPVVLEEYSSDEEFSSAEEISEEQGLPSSSSGQNDDFPVAGGDDFSDSFDDALLAEKKKPEKRIKKEKAKKEKKAPSSRSTESDETEAPEPKPKKAARPPLKRPSVAIPRMRSVGLPRARKRALLIAGLSIFFGAIVLMAWPTFIPEIAPLPLTEKPAELSKYEGKLLYINGDVEAATTPKDAIFNIEERTLALRRVVEVYQWAENGREKIWSETLIKAPEGRQNPDKLFFKSKTFPAEQWSVLGLAVPEDSRQGIELKFTERLLQEEDFARLSPDGKKAFKLFDGRFIWAKQALNPEVGALRIGYLFMPPERVSLLGTVKDGAVAPFTYGDGKIFVMRQGNHSAEELLQGLPLPKDEDAAGSLGLMARLAGAGAVLIGLLTIAAPFLKGRKKRKGPVRAAPLGTEEDEDDAMELAEPVPAPPPPASVANNVKPLPKREKSAEAPPPVAARRSASRPAPSIDTDMTSGELYDVSSDLKNIPEGVEIIGLDGFEGSLSPQDSYVIAKAFDELEGAGGDIIVEAEATAQETIEAVSANGTGFSSSALFAEPDDFPPPPPVSKRSEKTAAPLPPSSDIEDIFADLDALAPPPPPVSKRSEKAAAPLPPSSDIEDIFADLDALAPPPPPPVSKHPEKAAAPLPPSSDMEDIFADLDALVPPPPPVSKRSEKAAAPLPPSSDIEDIFADLDDLPPPPVATKTPETAELDDIFAEADDLPPVSDMDDVFAELDGLAPPPIEEEQDFLPSAPEPERAFAEPDGLPPLPTEEHAAAVSPVPDAPDDAFAEFDDVPPLLSFGDEEEWETETEKEEYALPSAPSEIETLFADIDEAPPSLPLGEGEKWEDEEDSVPAALPSAPEEEREGEEAYLSLYQEEFSIPSLSEEAEMEWEDNLKAFTKATEAAAAAAAPAPVAEQGTETPPASEEEEAPLAPSGAASEESDVVPLGKLEDFSLGAGKKPKRPSEEEEDGDDVPPLAERL
jgi:hypothetical protein